MDFLTKLRPGIGLRRVWLAAVMVCVGGCEGDKATVALQIFLRTDYQPARDFGAIETTVETDDGPVITQTPAAFDATYIDGLALEFYDALVPTAERVVTVTLTELKNEPVVLDSQTVRFEHLQDRAITLTMTQDCFEVQELCAPTASNPNRRCFGGKCVSQTCVSGSEDACGITTKECDPETEATDCLDAGPCAVPRCLSGLCLYDAASSAVCPSGEICDYEDGCVPAQPQL